MYSGKHLGCTISDMGLEPFHTYLCNINTGCPPLDFPSSREKLLKRWLWNGKTPQLRTCQKRTSIVWQSERPLGLSSSPAHARYHFLFTIILEARTFKLKGWWIEHLLSLFLKDVPDEKINTYVAHTSFLWGTGFFTGLVFKKRKTRALILYWCKIHFQQSGLLSLNVPVPINAQYPDLVSGKQTSRQNTQQEVHLNASQHLQVCASDLSEITCAIWENYLNSSKLSFSSVR